MNNPKFLSGPALLLMLFAPLATEVLPGATRFSSIFVFPIEFCVWGGGALLIREAALRWKLGWVNILLLALALSSAEEFLIQQTSVAPLVIKLKGIEYARAMGVNYVYLLWALIYESVFVVFVPVYLLALIFPTRTHTPLAGKAGLIFIGVLFLMGSFLAWYTWTQIARTTVFHQPPYNPSLIGIIIPTAEIGLLIFFALGTTKNKIGVTNAVWSPPPHVLLFIFGAVWAALLFGLVVLAFGASPDFPPAVAICSGLLLAFVACYLVPRWTNSEKWNALYSFTLLMGVLCGSWGAGFVGFIDAEPKDLYFKIITNVVALILIMMLGMKLRKPSTS